jgi:hypothetical protein
MMSFLSQKIKFVISNQNEFYSKYFKKLSKSIDPKYEIWDYLLCVSVSIGDWDKL